MAGLLNSFFAGVALSPQVAGVTLVTGDRASSAEAAPPRVVFVVGEERFGPPGGYAGDSLNSPRTIWRRLVPIKITCWATGGTGVDADDTDATEALMTAVVQAIHQQSWTGFFYQLTTGKWIEGGTASLGKKYELNVIVQLPLTMPVTPEVMVTEFTETTEGVDPETGDATLNV